MMNIKVTNFITPFSFFCITDEKDEFAVDVLRSETERNFYSNTKKEVPKLVHGQYVAVMWKGSWVRGIVDMQTQFLIWLVDHGVHIRYNDKLVCVDLVPEFKKIPSKIFEASIHGVMPVVKTLSCNFSELEDKVGTTWNQAAIAYSQHLINSATKTVFVPVALLNTQFNTIVLGDLYLKLPDKGLINIADELQQVATFLEKDPELYVQNLSTMYTSRRRHRACSLKPNIPDIPSINLNCEFSEYSAICADVPKLQLEETSEDHSSDGSTMVDGNEKVYALTAEEIEEYANLYVDICGKEYNLLNLLENKIEDMNDCERFKKYANKGVGRGCGRMMISDDSD